MQTLGGKQMIYSKSFYLCDPEGPFCQWQGQQAQSYFISSHHFISYSTEQGPKS